MVRLESCKLFGSLPHEELAELQRAGREQLFTAGQEIFREGDPGDALYVIGHGQVEISGLIGAARHTFSRFGPGDFFGEMAVLDDKPRSATARAIQETELFLIPRGAMLQLLDRSPAVSLELLRQVSRRLRQFDDKYLRDLLQQERLAVVGRFARAIVHDLKNPLTIIGLSLDVLCDENAASDVRRTAGERVRRQVQRIGQLVDDIMEFTQTQQPASELVPTNFAAFVEQTLAELRPELEVKSANVRLGNPPPATTLALNTKRFRRVLANLLHNAADAMVEGGEIILRFERTETELITQIEDHGPGIAPEVADQLFEPFVTHGKAHGTGLGLSICKRIVEDHRGRIWARNRPEGGAVFSLALPLPK